MPGPINSQRRRSLGRPSAKRGYQSIGTDTLRPSRNSTTSACPVTLTCLAAAASVAGLEVAMPCLQQLGLVLLHQRRNLVLFVRGKSKVVLQPARAATRTWRLSVARHMDVRRFAPVAASFRVNPPRSQALGSLRRRSKPLSRREAAQAVEIWRIGVGRVGRRDLEKLVDLTRQYHAHRVHRVMAC